MTREKDCHSCGAPVVWACTEHDRRMPLDRAPDPAGRFVVETWQATGHGMSPVVHWLRDYELFRDQRPRYRSHYDTCTEARSA
jgi:hypothetical protein